MKHEIHGTVMQTLEITLDQGDMIYSQTHQLAYMNAAVNMGTNLNSGGIIKSIWRTFSGSTLFRNEFTAPSGNGLIAFCPRFPGKIIAHRLQAGETLICRKETFLCAEASVTFENTFQQKIGAGLFGGEGFILQKVTGPGMVFLDLSGEVVEKVLQPGETLRVHVGHVGVQDASVQFGIQLVKGFKNVLFGGDGIFFATLTGPGRVLMQSMPIANLADEVMKYAGGGGARDTNQGNTAADLVGGFVGSLLDGNN